MAPSLRSTLAAGAAAGAAVASLRALARPLPGAERRLLDWEEVRRVARSRTGERGERDAAADAARARAYDAMAAELAPLMAEVCGSPVEGYPGFQVIDRRGFVDRNLVIVQRLFEPVERLRARIPESRVTALGRRGLSRYVGELFGFLSRRVLGQYDPVLMLAPPAAGAAVDDTALYLVEPNVAAFEAQQEVPPDNLRRWLVLHELTHAWQFESHPWLREHIGSLMNEVLMNELVGLADESSPSPARVLGVLPRVVGSQLRAVQRVQAVMSVCEGYSNFVMHRVGVAHLEDFDRLEAAFHERKAQRSALERLVLAVTGISMKMRQYEVGERFAEAVTARGGLALLNRVWDGPEWMPSGRELREPDLWLRRVGAAA